MKGNLDFAASESTVLVASEGVIFSDLNGEVVILNMNNGTYYGLDEVGHRVWTMIQEPVSLKDVQGAIVDEYDVDPERCGQDLRA